MIEISLFGAVRGLSAKEKETDGMYRLVAVSYTHLRAHETTE